MFLTRLHVGSIGMRARIAVLGLIVVVAGCGRDMPSPPTMTTTRTTPAASQVPTSTPGVVGSLATTTPQSPLLFSPILLSGRGDAAVDIAVPGDAPAIAIITHAGSGNFTVGSHGSNGDVIGILVDRIGAYRGTRPINLTPGEAIASFEISADGDWTVMVESILDATHIAGASFSGIGDEVLFDPDPPPQAVHASITYEGDDNFAVGVYGDAMSLVVDEIGPYAGTVLVPANAVLWEITAGGHWAIDVSG